MSSFLEKHNISPESLLYKSSITCIGAASFCNGLAVDLYNFATEHNLILKQYYYDWVSAIVNMNINEINKEALLSKVHRILKQVKGKRGEAKLNYLNERFVIPSQTVASSAQHVKPAQHEKLLTKVKEKAETLAETREKSKQLKRKLQRLETKFTAKNAKLELYENENKQLKQVIKSKERNMKQVNYKLGKKIVKNSKCRLSLINMKNTELELKENIKEYKSEVANLRDTLRVNEEVVASATQTAKELAEANLTIDYMQALLNDSPDVQLCDETSSKYNNETVMCVMNLTDMKVPVERVGPVISEVAKLCGKTVDRVPYASTVNRIVDSKLAQKQVGSVLKEKDHTTLYTDETRKYGKCMQSYIVTDEEQNSYVLGLREMVDKSGQSTLDVFKDILSDISAYCHEAVHEKDIGCTILSNIRDTMSDRASTEKHFNNLLEQFRSEILPQVIDNWENLSEEERQLCSKMNNFYCGLHLLVGMADTCESTLKKN